MQLRDKLLCFTGVAVLSLGMAAHAQMTDNTQATSTSKAGINKSLTDEIGAGRGDVLTPNSSVFIINRDPYRSVRRGRQLFQRKFTRVQGQGANEGDGVGNLDTDKGIGAGLSDSCALCHGRPRGSAGSGGNVVTRPDSRDAGHLFGLGLKEMLADEITTDLRNTRDLAVTQALQSHRSVTKNLVSKGIHYGSIETVYDPVNAGCTTDGFCPFNSLFATATTLYQDVPDGSGYPDLKVPLGGTFVVKDIFTDFKRHDVGANFYERNWDGTLQTTFLTRPLWGVGTTAPYGHDGRSLTLNDVIIRHGGEAKTTRDAFLALSFNDQNALFAFLNSLVLFPPDDTASNLDPADPTKPNFPQFGHGSIKLMVLFNDPTDPE